MTSFCKVEGNYLKTEENMVKLFYHEAVRQFADKILMKHDLDWFLKSLRQVIWDNFDLRPYDEDYDKARKSDAGEEEEEH